MDKFDTIVIGSGIGGLAIGAILVGRRRGDKVLILEKNSGVGGRLFSYERDGFKLDVGAHVLSRSDKGPLGEILRLVGKQDSIGFTYVRPLTHLQDKFFPFPRGLRDMVPEKDFERLHEMFASIMAFTPGAIEELDETDLRSYVQTFTANPMINACINNISIVYTCVPYHRASAGEFVRCIQAEAGARASGYPIGGCGALAQTIAAGITELGGAIRTNARVDRIIVDGGVAQGVVAGGETYLADTIVSNGDIKHTIMDLVGEDKLESQYLDRITSLEYSYAGLVVRMALDEVLTDWKLITHIASDDPLRYHEILERGETPDDLNAFISVPSNFSPNVAPDGKQLLSLSAAVPYDFPDMDSLTRLLIELPQRLLPGIDKHVMWTDVTTPLDLNKAVGEQGAIIGVGQTVRQSGKNRPPVTCPIKNLYFCGAEAGGWGVGIELAIESAKSLSLLIP